MGAGWNRGRKVRFRIFRFDRSSYAVFHFFFLFKFLYGFESLLLACWIPFSRADHVASQSTSHRRHSKRRPKSSTSWMPLDTRWTSFLLSKQHHARTFSSFLPGFHPKYDHGNSAGGCGRFGGGCHTWRIRNGIPGSTDQIPSTALNYTIIRVKKSVYFRLIDQALKNEPTGRALHQSINQSISRMNRSNEAYSINQSINQWVHQSINQSIVQWVDRSINQSISRALIKSINQSINLIDFRSRVLRWHSPEPSWKSQSYSINSTQLVNFFFLKWFDHVFLLKLFWISRLFAYSLERWSNARTHVAGTITGSVATGGGGEQDGHRVMVARALRPDRSDAVPLLQVGGIQGGRRGFRCVQRLHWGQPHCQPERRRRCPVVVRADAPRPHRQFPTSRATDWQTLPTNHHGCL